MACENFHDSLEKHEKDYILLKNNFDTNNFQCEKLVEINFSGCNLPDLPKVLSLCVNVKSVNFSNNSFRQLPACLVEAFYKLQFLDLSNNLLQDFNTPLKSKSLSSVILANNMVKILPKWLWTYDLPNLSFLDLSGNMKVCNKDDIYEILNCKISLTKFKIVNTQFNESVSDILCTMPYLTEFYLGENNSRNSNDFLSFPSKDKYWMNIEVINLCNISLNDLNSDICNMKNLVELDLRFNNLTWLPDNFGSLISLKICLLNDNHIIMLPDSLCKLINLRKLHVANNQLCSLPVDLEMFRSLEEVDLYNNVIDKLPDGADLLKCYDIGQNYLDEPESASYVKQKSSLCDSYCYNYRISGRKISEKDDFHSENDELCVTDLSDIESDSDGNLNVEVDGVVEMWDLNEQWEPEYNDDYWEPSQDNFNSPIPSPDTLWNNFVQQKILEGNYVPAMYHIPPVKPQHKVYEIEEGQFSDD